MHLSIFLTSMLLGAAITSPVAHPKALHEKRERMPREWIKTSPVHKDMTLPMRIGLTQSNLDQGHDMLMAVSSHDSPNYGKYWSAEEVAEIFAPAQESVETVKGWLEEHDFGNVSVSANKQWLQFDAAAGKVEQLLSTKYHVFEHAPSGATNIACDEYHLPATIRKHVDYLTPGIKLFATSAGRNERRHVDKRTFGATNRKPGKLPPIIKPLPMALDTLLGLAESDLCGAAATPQCIATLYNITQGTTAHAGNELGVFEDLGDYYNQADLNNFFLSLYPRIPQGTHPKLDSIDGGMAPIANVTLAGPESDLDFQISYPIIWPQNSILFQTDDQNYEDDYEYEGFLNNFLDALDGSYCSYSAYSETGNSPLDPPYPDPAPGGFKGALECGIYKPTNVISISYGGQEADLPVSYQRRQCNEFMKLGMQAVTTVVSSGDSGVAGPPGDDSPNGCLGSGNIFSPDFPANCPYILTVGATFLPAGGDVNKDEEIAVTRFPSGGGFSNIYPIASYQQHHVATYLTDHTPPYPSYSTINNVSIGANGGIYNRAGRGYPDVSAIGDNVLIWNAGRPRLIGGTSASAPTWGAILTRINEERLSAGKSTVGFVNPVLYAHDAVFHDITVGSNPGCGTDGFSVASGWDPVTGLGTPNYPKVLALFMSLP